MSNNKRKNKNTRGHQRRFSVRAVRRDAPDVKKVSQALIALAIAEAEKDAQAQHEKDRPSKTGDAA